MLNNSKMDIIFGILLIAVSAEARKPLASGDIVGRDLLIPGLGWVGHVGIGTGDDVGKPTQLIVEVLNENRVIQFNSLGDFTSRSKYWGSRSGIGDYASGTYAALVEAHHQSWWCPSYSNSTAYVIGQGNVNKRIPTVCGLWRCDTFVAWDFYSAGFPQLMNNHIMLPINVYNTFPYANGDTFSDRNVEKINPLPLLSGRDLDFNMLTADELNHLSYKQFVEIVDIPIAEETPSHIQREWEFLFDLHVNDVKRGILIDRLAIVGDQDLVPRFQKLYKENNENIRSNIIKGLMIYYQNHWDLVKTSSDFDALRNYYSELLIQRQNKRDLGMILRGYIDFHTSDEILKKRKVIEHKMRLVDPQSRLGLQLELAYKSSQLEREYIPVIISMLEQYKQNDLYAMFFGITSLWHKNLRNLDSVDYIKNYLRLKEDFFTKNEIHANDMLFKQAKISYDELNRALS